MLFSHLKDITNGQLNLYSDSEVIRFSTDSRTLTGNPSEVFVAIRGKRDGHDYVKSAWEKGVRNFILEKDLQLSEANSLVVESSLMALQ
ncbi:MAG: bifunctional UDP-N-acetylmuramoyl-tripeptide:D-alanyl-D-alanine ligase/alanine racemase, partial [Ekhidna sp.]